MTGLRLGFTFEFDALSNALLVWETGSFRATAARLGIRPSVVSRRVQRLEDRLGVRLFRRQSRGAQPTLAGAKLLDSAKSLVDDLDELLQAAGRAEAAKDGCLKIGVSGSIAGGGLRHVLESVLRDRPLLDLDVVEGSARHHLAAVRGLRLDAAVLVGDSFTTDCEVEPLWSERLLVALPAGHRLADLDIVPLESLAEDRFMVSREDPGPEIHDYIVRRLEKRGAPPNVAVRSVRREGLMALIGLDRAVTLVCEAEAEVSYPGVVLRPLNSEMLPLSLVWSRRNDNSVLKSFLSLARDQARHSQLEHP